MNVNIVTYVIYFSITAFLTLRVGLKLFHHGGIYLKELFPDKEAFCTTVNRMLLLGYFLVNLGYPAVLISEWPDIETWRLALETLSRYLGIVLLILGILHFINLLGLYFLSFILNKTQHKLSTH